MIVARRVGEHDAGVSSIAGDGRFGPGVYFLWHNAEMVYAGQSVNILKRLCEHGRDKIFDSSSFQPLPEPDLTFVESYAIWFFQPKYNRQVLPLGSTGTNNSGRLKQSSVDFVVSMLRSLDPSHVVQRFADASAHISHLHAKTSYLHYKTFLTHNERRNMRVLNLLLGDATDGTRAR